MPFIYLYIKQVISNSVIWSIAYMLLFRKMSVTLALWCNPNVIRINLLAIRWIFEAVVLLSICQVVIQYLIWLIIRQFYNTSRVFCQVFWNFFDSTITYADFLWNKVHLCNFQLKLFMKYYSQKFPFWLLRNKFISDWHGQFFCWRLCFWVCERLHNVFCQSDILA